MPATARRSPRPPHQRQRSLVPIAMLTALCIAGSLAGCAPRVPAPDTATQTSDTVTEATPTEAAPAETAPEATPADVSSFVLEGKWKVTEGSFGVAQTTSIVIFNGTETNIFSPRDTYAFYEDGGRLRLDLTGALGGNASFTVKITDPDSIDLTVNDEVRLRLTRVS